jgi:hypothetical protein
MKKFWSYVLIAFIMGLCLGSLLCFSITKYEMISIKDCAEKIIVPLEIITACKVVGNVTDEQIKEQWVKMFIIPKS